MSLQFWIPGVCKPGGSKKSFRSFTTGHIVTMDDCEKNAAWRDTVAYFVRKEYRDAPLDCPLQVRFSFFVKRPGTHFGTRKKVAYLKDDAPKFPTVKPDVTKLVRAAEDALTGILWRDDSLIVVQAAIKAYANEPGLQIEVAEHLDGGADLSRATVGMGRAA